MSHSFTKLDLMLQSRDLYIQNIYSMNGYCVFIEVFSTTTSDVFLIYIPSQFNIPVEKYTSYELKYIDVDTSQDIVGNYAQEPSVNELKSDYFGIELDTVEVGDDIESNLVDNYGREIKLKDINQDDKMTIKDILRQLKRFKLCTQNICYKMSILFKNYLCSIKRDDTIECCYILKFPPKTERNLMITVDLKSLYKKTDTLCEDMCMVRESLYTILNQNQDKHTRLIEKILSHQEMIRTYTEIVYTRKQELSNYISKLQGMIEKLDNEEIALVDQLDQIKKRERSDVKNIHVDMDNTRAVHAVNVKLDKLLGLKKEVIEDICKSKVERDNLYICIDKNLFDNSIMLNEINKNFNEIVSIL